MALTLWESDPKPMKEDAFISGLRALFAANQALKPATVSKAAGLDVSTIRKLLDGTSTNPTRRTMESIAAHLNTTAEAIANGSAAAPETPQPSRGFSESQAAPYTPSSNGTLADLMIRNAGHGIAGYVVKRAAPSLAFLAGDILAVNLATSPQTGDLVLIGHSSPDLQQTITTIRRYYPPFAISTDPGEADPVLPMTDNGQTVWRGTIVAMFRPNVQESHHEF